MKKEYDFADSARNPYAEVAPRLSAKWKREIRRRCAEMDRGAKLSDAENVFARARKSLG
jgi:hypothetical protein